MEPLNKAERKAAIQKFSWVYALSLALPLVAFYFLFRSPGGSLAGENEQLKKQRSEHDLLLTRFDSLTKMMRALQKLDEDRLGANEAIKAELDIKIENYKRNIQDLIAEDVKKVAPSLDGLAQTQADGITHSYEIPLVYRKRYEDLQEMLVAKGGDDATIAQLRSDLAAKDAQINNLNLMLAMKDVAKGGGGGGGGGGGAPKPSPTPGGGGNEAAAGDAKEVKAQLSRCLDANGDLRQETTERQKLGRAQGIMEALSNKKVDYSRKEVDLLKGIAWQWAEELKTTTRNEQIKIQAMAVQTQAGNMK
ncbi:MAG: hypothetical protein MUC97_18615 [Bernardetiaceae bacterium]|jgi:hypothetical protein|nr:hypothetical protein [Bernardetiaceae bacterium]